MHKASASIHKRGSVLRSVPLRLRDTTVHGAVHGTMKGARRAPRGGGSKFGVQTVLGCRDRFQWGEINARQVSQLSRART